MGKVIQWTGNEHSEQVALFEWAATFAPRYPQLALLFAVPNGGHRHISVAARMKREGQKAGVRGLTKYDIIDVPHVRTPGRFAISAQVPPVYSVHLHIVGGQSALHYRGLRVLAERVVTTACNGGRFAVPKIERICKVCNRTFCIFPSRLKLGTGEFCSSACMVKGRTGENSSTWKGGLATVVCLVCGTEFQTKPSRQKKGLGKYCSRKCGGVGRSITEKGRGYTQIAYNCLNCGKESTVKPSHAKNGEGKFCSPHCSTTWNIKNMRTHHSRGSAGKREDLGGLFVRSSWEANYARYLNWLVSLGEIKSWSYETDTFEFKKVKRGNRFYTPDFKIVNNDNSIEYHEVKGYMDPASATKMKRMAEVYPDIVVHLIDQDVYYAVANKVKGFIPEWETRSREPRAITE